MTSIAENLRRLKHELPQNVSLVAVSKTKSESDIMEAYQHGQRIFGENRVQEMVAKSASLPKDIEWHMIGHLQRNKVKYIAPFVSLIHSVDTPELLLEINKQAGKNARTIPVLLQFHIAEEDTKSGLTLEEAQIFLHSNEFLKLKNIEVKGVMGMATFTEDVEKVSREFRSLKKIFETLRTQHFPQRAGFKELSMGMSSDYHLAISEGTTMVRLGSSIFGNRG